MVAAHVRFLFTLHAHRTYSALVFKLLQIAIEENETSGICAGGRPVPRPLPKTPKSHCVHPINYMQCLVTFSLFGTCP